MEIKVAQRRSFHRTPNSVPHINDALNAGEPTKPWLEQRSLAQPPIGEGTVAAALRNEMIPSIEPVHAGSRLKPRLGLISFINALPVIVPIVKRKVELEADVFYDEPAILNEALKKGVSDISAVSSFHYLKSHEVTLLPGVSISSRTEVGSVLLFSKFDLDKLNDKPVAVPGTSATSVALLKILLAETFSVIPKIVAMHSPDPYDEGFAATCLFGDQALKFDLEWRANTQPDLYRHDLASWWHSMTGLPMVFAVWAARNDWISDNREAYIKISDALARSASIGCGEMLPEVVGRAGHRVGIGDFLLRKYYKDQLCFELDAPQLDGLKTFAGLCRAHGLLN